VFICQCLHGKPVYFAIVYGEIDLWMLLKHGLLFDRVHLSTYGGRYD